MVRKRRFLIVLLSALLFMGSASSAHAATWYANSSTGSDSTGTGASASPFATFSTAYNAAASSGDTINLTGTFNESNTAESSSTEYSGFDLNKSLSIVGQGAGVTFVEASSTAGTANRSVFTIPSGKTVTIKGLTIRYGVALLGQEGGGISNDGTVILDNDDITNNKYNNTNNYGAGGVYTDTNNASTTVATSTVENNIFNGAYYGAGGLFVLGNSSSVSLSILNSSVINNTTTSTATGAFSYAAGSGGVETFRVAALRILNSTIAHNSTNEYGGGLNLYDSTQTITNSTIADNTGSEGAGGILWESTSGSKLYLENDLVANNSTASTSNDFWSYDSTSASQVVDNGYNAIGYSQSPAFSTSTDITGSSAGSDLSSTLATNGSTQGPETLALLAGSPAINAGTATANDGVAILNTDERGATRNGATDIGAYEYGGGGLADVTPPTVSVTAPTSGATVGGTSVALTANASDDVAVGGVTFYIDGTKQGSEITSSPYTYTWNSMATSSGSHSVFAVARDTSNNYATSTVVSFTVNNNGPVITSVASSTTATTTTITWTTDEAASSTVDYGPTVLLGMASSSSASVTSHSITLTGLSSSSKYDFQVSSTDGFGNTTSASGYSFTTTAPPDTTPPTVSVTSPTTDETVSGSSVALTASASDNVAVAGVTFYINGTKQGSEITASPYATTWNSTATTSGTQNVFAVARDTSNNYATSTTISFITDNPGPVPSSISATTTSSTATIAWTTNIQGSTQVDFGPSSGYGSSTPELDTSPRVTSHSVMLTALAACTVYHYQVISRDSALDAGSSTDETFSTTGCTGGAAITSWGEGAITITAGGSLTQGALTLTVPTSFTASSTQAVFEANEIASAAFIATAGTPSGLNEVGSSVFTLIALTDATTTLSTFIQPLTITLSYSPSDVINIDVSSLKIYRYDSPTWTALDGCSVNTSARTVTCTTSNFSDFAIFGNTQDTSSNTTTSTTSGEASGSIQTQVANLEAMGKQAEAQALMQQWPNLFPTIASTSAASSTNPLFSRNLERGMTGRDVLQLQQFLNAHGFTVATSGPGSSGNETDFFGSATKAAVEAFQRAKGITPIAGYFGPITRKAIETL